MKKPQIELRNIKTHSGLSKETHAYTATLWVDGKRWGTVENDGHGGPDNQHPDKGGGPAVIALENLIKETHPKRWVGSDFFPNGCDQDLEGVCAELLEVALHTRFWTRKLKSQLVMVEGGEIFTWKRKFPPTPKNISHLQGKHPDGVIINSLSKVEALETLRQVEGVNA